MIVAVALMLAFTPITASAKKMTVRQIAKMSKDVAMKDYVEDSLPVTVGKAGRMKVDAEKAYIFSKVVNTTKGLFLVWDIETEIRVKSSEVSYYIEGDENVTVSIDQNTAKGVKKWLVMYDESQNMTPWYVEEENGTTYEVCKVGKYCWKLIKEK